MAVETGKRVTDDELKQIIAREINHSKEYGWSLKEQREQAQRYYQGEKFGNELPGRSQVVLREVQDVIEWIMPSIMRVFTSGDDVVEFEAESEEDVKAAQQETDYVNYVFMRDNPGWEILHDLFKDALMLKTGIGKVWWDDTENWEREEYTGLTEAGLMKLLEDPAVRVKEHTAVPIELNAETGMPVPEMLPQMIELHDIVIERNINHGGRVRVAVVPPEEFYISNRARGIHKDQTPFMAHRTEKTIAELVEEGYKGLEGIDIEHLSGDDEQEYDIELIARHSSDETYTALDIQESSEPLMRRIWVTEAYVWVDYDGDGKAEYRKVTMAADRILDNEAVDDHPFIYITPIRIPHKFYGQSISDVVMDLQYIKSVLLRNMLDNVYLQNNQRYEVVTENVELDDLLTSRPYGVVRVSERGSVTPLANPQLPATSFSMLEYLDVIRDQRTGVSKQNFAVDADVLKKTTATAYTQAMTNAQARVELIIRMFAETGIKDLFTKIHTLVRKHQNQKRYVRLRNEWVDVDPTEWRHRADMSVSVGLGNGSREQNMIYLKEMAQSLFELRQDPELSGLVSKENVYNIFEQFAQNMGFKNVRDFMTDPKQAQPKQQGPSPEQEAAQMEMQVKQMEMQVKQQELQLKAKEIQSKGLDTMNRSNEARVKAWEMQQNIALKKAELQEKARQFDLQLELDSLELEIEAQLEREQERGVEIGA